MTLKTTLKGLRDYSIAFIFAVGCSSRVAYNPSDSRRPSLKTYDGGSSDVKVQNENLNDIISEQNNVMQDQGNYNLDAGVRDLSQYDSITDSSLSDASVSPDISLPQVSQGCFYLNEDNSLYPAGTTLLDIGPISNYRGIVTNEGIFRNYCTSDSLYFYHFLCGERPYYNSGPKIERSSYTPIYHCTSGCAESGCTD